MFWRYDAGGGIEVEVHVEDGLVRWVGWMLGPLKDDWSIGTQNAEEFLAAPLRDDVPADVFDDVAVVLGRPGAPHPAPVPAVSVPPRPSVVPPTPTAPAPVPAAPAPTPDDPRRFEASRIIAREADRWALLAWAGQWMSLLDPGFVARHPAHVGALATPVESDEPYVWRLWSSRPPAAGWAVSTYQEEDGRGGSAASRVHTVEAIGAAEGVSLRVACTWHATSPTAVLSVACAGEPDAVTAVRRAFAAS